MTIRWSITGWAVPSARDRALFIPLSSDRGMIDQAPGNQQPRRTRIPVQPVARSTSRTPAPQGPVALVTACLVALLCAACAALAEPLSALAPTAEPTPRPSRSPRPPARWRMRFCEAQVTVKRALIIIDQTHARLERRGSAAWFEEVGDDLADLSERALVFLDLVPDWRPARPLVAAERAMLEAAFETGEMIERIGDSGRSEPRSPAVLAGMRSVERRRVMMARAVERAEQRRVPCARPDIPTTEEIVGG
jgi:hypothetical protein